MAIWRDMALGGARFAKAVVRGADVALGEYLQGDVSGDLDTLSKAGKREPPPSWEQGKAPSPRAWDLDPMDVQALMSEQMQGPHHPGTLGLTYDTLRAMARYPILSAIVNTRVNQIAEYAVAQTNPHRVGFRIVMRDTKAKGTRASEKRIAELSRFAETCGDTRIQAKGNANLEMFVRKVMRDSMILDQGVFEVVHTRGGRPAGFLACDAATFRRAQFTADELKAGRRLPDETAYCQIVQNRVVARFEPEELCFGIRRPRTDLHFNGYGYAELENLIRVLTYLLNTETYNANNFTHGMHASGLIALKSKMSPQLFRAFRREFYAMLAGAANAKKTAIIQLDPDEKEEIQNVNLSQNNKEMEFSQWQSFLIKVAHAEFQMDPAENGYLYGNEGQTASLSQSGPNDRIIASRERGLYPTLRRLESWLDDYVFQPLDPDFKLTFGVDIQTENDKLDMILSKVGKVISVNEARAELDLKPLQPKPDAPVADWGPLDPTYINAIEQSNAAAQQQQGQGQDPGQGQLGGEDPGWGNYDDGGDDGQPPQPALPAPDAGDGDPGGDAEPDMGALFGGLHKGGKPRKLRVEIL